VRSGVDGVVDVVARLAANPAEHAVFRAQVAGHVRRAGRSFDDEIESYRGLVERIMETLRSKGSSRPLDLPHLAARHFSWPATMRRTTLSDVSLPPV
jgi:hypothetical protein